MDKLISTTARYAITINYKINTPADAGVFILETFVIAC